MEHFLNRSVEFGYSIKRDDDEYGDEALEDVLNENHPSD
jgi:hypothetical protein